MLKVLGTIYSNDKQDFDKITKALTDAGYEIGYINQMQGNVMEEVDSLDHE